MGWFESVTGRSSSPSPKSQSDAPAGAYLGTRTSTGGSLVATGDRRTGRDSRTGDIVSLISESSGEPSMRHYSESSGTGGGGGSVPKKDDKSKDDEKKKADELKAKQDKTFTDALAEALGYGSKQVGDLALNQGLVDQYGVLDAFSELVNKQKRSLDPYDDTTPTIDEYLNRFKLNDAFTEALGAKTNRYRSDLTNSLNEVAGEGFENVWFGDTADDAVLNAILGQQKTDATTVLDRALKRGQLNDIGFNRAMGDIDTQYKAGLGKLQDIGGGILQGYRDRVGNERTNALSRIGGASFGQPYDVNPVLNQLNNLKSSLTGGLEADILGAIGGQKFFDTSTAIGSGGVAQGTTNPSKINFKENPLLASFDDKRSSSGTGSTATTGRF